ncbi:DNA helicase [Fusarium sporotrichioides]|uniref:DNA helicase n=1 Tax=Fusarium sporotrichioides TaxID=5514 RepID=A0A395SGC1_FUSSP|nr:DNA helicase [Fusarium sporotrichioides]
MLTIQKRDNGYTNAFSNFGRVPVLDYLKRTGVTCSALSEQLRIAAGQFDMNKLYPIFIHYPGKYNTNENMSLYNTAQYEKAFDIAIGSIEDEEVLANHISIITPYCGKLECLQEIQKVEEFDTPDLALIGINTTDSFESREGYVVILLLGVNQVTGPRFVANKNRICAGIIRHVGVLFLIGDINTVPEAITPAEKNKSTLKTSDDLESEAVKGEVFWEMLNWFHRANQSSHPTEWTMTMSTVCVISQLRPDAQPRFRQDLEEPFLAVLLVHGLNGINWPTTFVIHTGDVNQRTPLIILEHDLESGISSNPFSEQLTTSLLMRAVNAGAPDSYLKVNQRAYGNAGGAANILCYYHLMRFSRGSKCATAVKDISEPIQRHICSDLLRHFDGLVTSMHLTQEMRSRVSIKTLDSAQGDEAGIVFIYAVNHFNLGHIGPKQRTTLALTRYADFTILLMNRGTFVNPELKPEKAQRAQEAYRTRSRRS